MWRHQKGLNFIQKLTLAFVITIVLWDTAFGLSDKRLCADEKCSRIISMAVTVNGYGAGQEGMVSFKANSAVRVKSKGAGSDPDLWGVEVNGRVGFAPKKFLRETKIYVKEKDLKYVVDVVKPGEQTRDQSQPSVLNNSEILVETTTTQPSKTIYKDEPIANSTLEIISNEASQTVTPVKEEVVVDGTKLTKFENVNKLSETPSVAVTEYEDDDDDGRIGDYDDDEGEGDDNRNESVGSASEEGQKMIVTAVSPNANETDTKLMESFTTKAETIGNATSAENTAALNENETAANGSKENTQEDTLKLKDNQGVAPVIPSENENKIKEAISDVQAVSKSSESTEKKPTVTNTYNSDPTNQPLTGSADILDKGENSKEPAGSGAKVDSVMETSLANSNNANETHQTVPNKTEEVKTNEEISTSDINYQALPTTTVGTNVVEQHISTQSTLPDTNIIVDGATDIPPRANSVDNTDAGEAVGVEGALIEQGPSKPTVGSQSHVPVETTTEFLVKTEQGQVNTNQYSTSTTEANNVQTSTESVPSQADTDQEPKTEHLDSRASNNLQSVSVAPPTVNSVGIAHPGETFGIKPAQCEEDRNKPTVGPQSYLSVEATTKFVENPEGVQANANRHSPPATEANNVQTSTESVPAQPDTAPDSEFNKTNPINSQSEHLNSHASKNVQFDSEAPPTVNSEDSAVKAEEGPSKPNEGQQSYLPVEATTQFVEKTEDAQVNSNQYSPPATEANNEEASTESVSSQTVTDPGSQFNKADPINSQTDPFESHASKNLQFDSQRPTDTQTLSPQPAHTHDNTNEYYTGSQYNPYDESSNTPLPPQYDNNHQNNLPQTTDIPHDYNGQQSAVYSPADLEPEVTTENPSRARTPEDSLYNLQSNGKGSLEPVRPLDTSTEIYIQEDDPKSLPSVTQPVSVVELDKKEKGLFATIMDTVNNILPNSKKPKHVGYDMEDRHTELDRILFSNMETAQAKNEDERFCEKLNPNNCPHSSRNTPHNSEELKCSLKSLITTEFTWETFLQVLASKILEISELIAFLAIVAATSLFFIFGYYCFCNSSSEGALLSKLNQLESSLLASHKENAILKHNLISTRQKLASIEDNSFGSNDMVVSLKKELEEELLEKARLQEQIVTLQKELENAADAGIELNKIVSELLSNQTGDESIISSVEELQKQLNEQQNTILEINASLADKSRENSELQLMIAEQNARFESQISDLQQDNDELEAEKGNLQSRLEEMRVDFDRDITAALESKNFEIKRLQNEIVELNDKVELGHTKWQTSMAKVEALEECLQNVKRDPNVNITQVIDVANIRAELLDAQRKYSGLKERWETELDARKLAENQLKSATAEVEKIKQDFNHTEKDKLEAQTRLEILSNYFKEKENQLQKELSLKETMWLKQRGETTTTVDRLTTMQDEIQSLKSQNDALRAEIEAQVAAHKAQTGTLENRAHETWLAARQSDRRYEEARAEATALRRKLTVLAGGNVNEVIKPTAGTAGLGDDLANAPSPIHMESPGSPMLSRMPPPPFLPPPFMGPHPPFMGMPPPPQFVPTGEMRPAPLGRIMSPPPPQRSGHIEFEDYLDYGGNSSWHRHHTYSPPPRTYRSLSPTDSRYNYSAERDLISTYDTETDFSPPPSPRESRRRVGGGGYGSDKEDSNYRHPFPYVNSKNCSSGSKAPISSGSDKSYDSSSKKINKSKSGGGGGGGKFLV